MKKFFPLLFSALFLLFPACGNRYTSRYTARALVRHNTSKDCNASFSSLQGTLVFKMKADGDCAITYSAQIEQGNVTVYYDSMGQKELLFSLAAGENVENSGGYATNNATVYIIIETAHEAEGKLAFHL